MRMTVSITGLKEALDLVQTGFSERRIQSVLAGGLNRTIREIAEAERRTMATVFDRPKPYTLGGVGIQLADIGRLQAEVFLKTSGASGRGAGKYLLAQIEGGPRQRKGFEVLLQSVGLMPQGWRAVPMPGAQDAFGGIERGRLRQIIQQLKHTSIGPQPKGARRRALGAVRRAGGQYFVMPEGGKAAPGIYQRVSGGREVRAVVLYVRSNVYRKRFDFHGVAAGIAQRRLEVHIANLFRESAARLAARGSAP